jgi:hypothetical protein
VQNFKITPFIKSQTSRNGNIKEPHFGSSVANIFFKLALKYVLPAISNGYLSDALKIPLIKQPCKILNLLYS